MQHGFPLRETSRRHGDFRVFAQIDFLPRAPVAAAIACADQQPPTFVKRQRVHQIITGRPETAGRAVGRNAVDLRASDRSAWWKRAERRLRIGSWRSARNCYPRLLLWRRNRGRRVRSRNREARSRAAAALLASGRSIDIARLVDCQRCNFFLGGAVENKTLALRGDAVHETAAIRASDQISISIEREHADVSFVTLEKDRSIPRRCDPENLTAIPGGDVKIAGCV